jgi:hypothetical protein
MQCCFKNRVLRTCATNVVDSSVVSLIDNTRVLGRPQGWWSSGEDARGVVLGLCTVHGGGPRWKAVANIGCYHRYRACLTREFRQIVGVRRGLRQSRWQHWDARNADPRGVVRAVEGGDNVCGGRR